MPDGEPFLRPLGPAAGEEGNDAPRCGYADLCIAAAPDGRSFLKAQRVRYPLHICRPFRLEGDPAGMVTIYLQSCAGGLYDGEDLRQRIDVEAGAAAHVTTQAASIVHDTPRLGALQTTRIAVGPGGFLEFMPDPLIFFPGARLTARLHADIHPTASFILSDSFILHDPQEKGRSFVSFRSETSIAVEGIGLAALDRYEISGEDLSRRTIGANGEHLAQGSIFILDGRAQAGRLAAALQQQCASEAGAYAMASTLPGGIGCWMRILAKDAVALRRAMAAAWATARLALTGTAPAPRRK